MKTKTNNPLVMALLLGLFTQSFPTMFPKPASCIDLN